MQEYILPFEKVQIWNLSLKLAVDIYKLTFTFPKEETYGMTSQIRRAANSSTANIAEGVCRFSEKEKGRFIEISFGSQMEVASFLFMATELGYVTKEQLNEIKPKILELSNKTNAFHKSLNLA